MERELGSVDFVGEEWNKHECALANVWGIGLLSVRQYCRADPFGWRSVVALLSLWEHTGMERCETLGMKHIQTCSDSKI